MTLQTDVLQTMGIEIWESKEMILRENPCSNQTADWETLESQVKCCQKCELHQTRTQAVFGIGSQQADLLFIGEAPGAREDIQGEPFVGRAGLLLNEMLKAIDLKREAVYIANILKCRPPNNRDPLPHEVESCAPYLQQQIKWIQPKVIIAVGRIAAQFLLNTKESIGRLRNKVHYYSKRKIPLVVTYHPAYLLRAPREKAKAYKDLCIIQKLLKN